MHPSESRDLWHLIESTHAVTYFAPGCARANQDLGFKGFWMGYFGARAAPMGAVGAAVVTAAFGGFAPGMVERAIPDAWGFVEPGAAVEGRASAAATALREALAEVDDVADQLLGVLDKALEVCEPAGRPLFAANKDVTPFEDPVADLWQMLTTLREHRGDGHLAVLTSEGVGGCEAHLLALASRGEVGGPAEELLRSARGWSDTDWTDSLTTLRSAGLLETGGGLSERGRKLHAHLEARTDELASPPFAGIGESGREHLRDCLIPIAASVVDTGWVPFPNPMGLPRVV